MITATQAFKISLKVNDSVGKYLKEIVEPKIVAAARSGSTLVYIHMGYTAWIYSEYSPTGLGHFDLSQQSTKDRKDIQVALENLGYVVAPIIKNMEDGKRSFGLLVEWR